MFNIGARLARYTGNSTYVDWAEKVWDWIVGVGFITQSGTTTDYIYDGASISDNCTTLTKLEWTYNYGLFLAGCAFLYDHTNDTIWETRATAVWSRAQSIFFDNGVMWESACQTGYKCNNDQRCFKAIFSRFLGYTALFIPSLKEEIMNLLETSAMAAAQSCSGGTDGHTCGLDWSYAGWDGWYGLGEQMSALEVIQNNLIFQKAAPLTNDTGGSSVGSYDAGTTTNTNLITNTLTITTKDRAGAGILTAVCLLGLFGTGFWMLR
jgi:mannan endo-1,6-alpha-mannosidase